MMQVLIGVLTPLIFFTPLFLFAHYSARRNQAVYDYFVSLVGTDAYLKLPKYEIIYKDRRKWPTKWLIEHCKVTNEIN
jgi:hypothetical protein